MSDLLAFTLAIIKKPRTYSILYAEDGTPSFLFTWASLFPMYVDAHQQNPSSLI